MFRTYESQAAALPTDELVLGLIHADLPQVQRRLFELVAGKAGGS